MMISRVNILGVGVSAVSMPTVLQTIESWINQHESRYICVSPVHSIMESQRDESLRRIHNVADLVTPGRHAPSLAESADGLSRGRASVWL